MNVGEEKQILRRAGLFENRSITVANYIDIVIKLMKEFKDSDISGLKKRTHILIILRDIVLPKMSINNESKALLLMISPYLIDSVFSIGIKLFKKINKCTCI